MKKLLLKLVASDQKHFNMGILGLRLFVGLIMLCVHGMAKLLTFSELSANFPDPLGVGSTISLIMILCAEVGCSLLLIFGLMTRLATLPLMFGMLMAFFVIHSGMPFTGRELPFLYVGIYVILLWTGGGKYALDEVIRQKLIRRVTPES